MGYALVWLGRCSHFLRHPAKEKSGTTMTKVGTTSMVQRLDVGTRKILYSFAPEKRVNSAVVQPKEKGGDLLP